MNKIDEIIVKILLRICRILTSYSEKISPVDIHVIEGLFKKEER